MRRMRFRYSYLGATLDELAAEYDIGRDALRRILKWQSWRHVSEVGPGATEADFHAAGAMQAKPLSRAEMDEMAASQKRFEAMVAESQKAAAEAPPAAYKPAMSPRAQRYLTPDKEKPIPTLDEIMKRQAELGAEHDAQVLGKLTKPTTRGDHLLGELGGKAGGGMVDSAIGGNVPPGTDGANK